MPLSYIMAMYSIYVIECMKDLGSGKGGRNAAWGTIRQEWEKPTTESGQRKKLTKDPP